VKESLEREIPFGAACERLSQPVPAFPCPLMTQPPANRILALLLHLIPRQVVKISLFYEKK
jgi:hypothetical protein